MKIEQFETRVVCPATAYREEVDGPGVLVANFVTLKIRTSDGVEGVGYGGFVAAPMLRALQATIDSLAEMTIGDDPLMIEAIGQRLLMAGGLGAPAGLVTRAVAAIDVALWDIKGKVLGQPVHRLLGGYRDRVPCYASGFLWRNYDAAALAKKGAELVEQGYRAMKFRMGAAPTTVAEIERMRALRDAVGDDVDLMVDINQGWDVNRSIQVGREMERCNLHWLEDPIDHQDYEGMAQIAAALDTPIAAGEYHYGIAPFRHMFTHRSVDIAMIDLLRAGGVTPWMKIAHLAESFNLPVVTHLAPEVLAHCLAAIPNGETVEQMPWSLPLFRNELRIEDGHIVLSDQPGLGLELDDEAAAKFNR
ncbi:MAG: mandelate racemase/muconate lactonizing enzyme family protein [Pirellulaceae bacterium]|nr:mandelate racemase/muconate lactonizing enzyme family protein [Pirellulaceae bacterium]